MKNNQLIKDLKLFYSVRIRHNSTLVYLDPTINIPRIYNFYMKNSEYYKLHYMYLYWINLNLVDKYD